MPRILVPDDRYNRQLAANAHPFEWTNPEPAPVYDLVVIGAGTAGLVCAAGAAGLGARVALVERSFMGGDCLVAGCVPSKALIRSSRAAADVRDAARFGIRVPAGAKVDFRAVMERVRRLRSELSVRDSANRFRDALGVDVFLGEGRFTARDRVGVEGRTLRFRRAVLATGSRPAVPPIPGLAEAGFLTNENVFSLENLPSRLAVIGGGPLGCELAQAFARLGSRVTLVEKGAQVLPREDIEVAALVEAALLRDGVEVALSSRIRGVSAGPSGKILRLDRAGVGGEFAVDEILVGTGRAPSVEDLGLEAAGVVFDPRSGIRVDDFLRTANRRVFAAGDVCSPFKFTHAADAMARVVVQNALFWGRKRVSALTIPWCTYTDPEVAGVGMSAREAAKKGVPVDTIAIPLREVDRAVTDGETDGIVQVRLRKGTDRILGASIVARHAGETITEVAVAMRANLGLRSISSVIHPYPTQAEGIRRAADACNRSRLTPAVKAVLRAFLRLSV